MVKNSTLDSEQKRRLVASAGRFNAPAMYGIKLSSDGKGWNVALTRQGIHFSRSFSHTVSGGKDQALVHAQAWRDEIVREHPPISRREEADRLRRNNKSGVVGVVACRNAQGQITGWVAQTHLGPGNHTSKYFGVRRHGEVDSLRLAIAERQRQLALMTGLRRVHPCEELVRSAPPRDTTLLPKAVPRTDRLLPSNKSGIVGVTYAIDPKGYARWIATTNVGGKRQMSKSFSVLTYGAEQAKTLAIAARAEQLRLKRQQTAAADVNGVEKVLAG